MGVETRFICHDCKKSWYCGKNVVQRLRTVLKDCAENHNSDTYGTDYTQERNGQLLVESSTGYDVLIPNYGEYERFDIEEG